MPSQEQADVAHLLKRTSFGVTAARVDELAARGWERALVEVVDQAMPPQLIACPRFENRYAVSEYDDFLKLLHFEMARLADPSNDGLGSRMLWFWHNVLTSGPEKAEPAFLCRQHLLLARHSLGNFRQMLIDITIDVAMLLYLDGWISSGDNPNQNYARELMELFALGRGNYTQRDVEAGARALAGWQLVGGDYPPSEEGQRFKPEQVESVFNSDAAHHEPVTFLGETRVHNVESIIDRILRQDACAKFIVRKMFQYFVHPSPDTATINSLAAVFRDSGYEIRPLVSAMFRHPDFRGQRGRGARARFPIEIVLAAAAAFSTDITAFDYVSYFDNTGFVPFAPPNVAGHAVSARWVAASQTLPRERLGLVAFDLPKKNKSVKPIKNSENPVEEVLRRASIYEVSPQTRRELERFARDESSPLDRARGLLALIVASPEFAMA